ncbi:MAG: SMP-30/gluconolactonase/LRE family protein [Acidobacteriota bacterium]
MRSILLAALLFLLPAGCAERNDHASVLPPDDGVAPVLVLLTKDKSSQGPVLGYDGSVYFSHGKNIRVVTPNGRHRLWAFEPGPRGHRILPDSTHLFCDAGRRAVLRLDMLARRLEIVARESEGQRLQSPAELALDQWNGIFFTDAGDPQAPTGGLHYATPGRSIRRLLSGLALPSGLALSSDWSDLYVLENGKNRILRFPIQQQGALGPMTVFAELPGSDLPSGLEGVGGLCFDASGNLYVGYPKMKDVLVLNSQGQTVRRYPIGNRTSGVCFGGPYLDQLYVTVCEPGALMRLNLGVRGLDLRPAR